ncbi:MAG: hypothetical protein HQK83_16375 [Fibrobacteria bacterium]|nr:hypothetical protein [Fibrobacteria bacterium]
MEVTNPVQKAFFSLIKHESRGRHGWANLLVFMMLVQFCLYLKDKKKNNLWIFLSLIGVQSFLSVRSAMLSAFASCLLVLIIHKGKQFKIKHILIFLLLTVALAYGFKQFKFKNYHVSRIQDAIPSIHHFMAITELEDIHFSSLGQRVEAIILTIKYWPQLTIKQKLIGDGFGSFKKYSGWGIHSHNSYIESLFNFGLLGIFLFLFFAISFIRSSMAIYPTVTREQQIAILVVFGFLISIMISSLVGNYFLASTSHFPLYILFGMIYALITENKNINNMKTIEKITE